MLNPDCPTRSVKGAKSTANFINLTPFDLQVAWLDYDGAVQDLTTIGRGGMETLDTCVGFAFQIKDARSGAAIAQFAITSAGQTVGITSAGYMAPTTPGKAVTVQFRNTSQFSVQLCSVNAAGTETGGATLEADTYLMQTSSAGAFWRVRTADSRLNLTEFIASDAPQQVCVIENTAAGFENHSLLTCDVFRQAFDGSEQKIATLVPKQFALVENYTARPWVVRDALSGVAVSQGAAATESFTLKIRGTFLNSSETGASVNVTFINKNSFEVDYFLIDPGGNHVRMGAIAAGTSFRWPGALAGFVWEFVEPYTQKPVGMYIASQEAEQTCLVQYRMYENSTPTSLQFINETHMPLEISSLGVDADIQGTALLAPGASLLLASIHVSNAYIARDPHSGLVLALHMAGREAEVVRLRDKHLHSLVGTVNVSVTFKNDTSFVVDVFAVDPQGSSTLCQSLRAGQSFVQATHEYQLFHVLKDGTGEKIACILTSGVGTEVFHIKLVSPPSTNPAQLEFSNRSLLPVDLYCVDALGTEILKASMAPHDHSIQATNVGTYWIAKDHASQVVLTLAVGKPAPQKIHINTKHLTSINVPSPIPCKVNFINNTPFKVTMYWVNYGGFNISYGTLAPGGFRQESTYSGHPWLFTAEGFEAPLAYYIPGNALTQSFTINNNLVLTQERPGGTLLEGELALYEQENYKGAVWILHSPLSDFGLVQGLDNKIASVRVGPNTGVSLYTVANFGGQTFDIYMDTPSLKQTPVGNNTLSSIKFWHTINPESQGISCRSTLVQDRRKNDRGQMVPFPNYRTILSLPPWVKNVDIWASDELNFESGGQHYTVDSQKPARLTPNRLSKVVINIEANTLSVPSLEIRANTMHKDERFLIFPDVALHTRLANLPDGAFYQHRNELSIDSQFDQAACDTIQQSIQNMANTVQYTYQPQSFGVHHGRQITAANMEHAHWMVDFSAGAPAYRPLNPAEVPGLTAGATVLQVPLAQNIFDDLGGYISNAASIVVHTVTNVGEDVVETGKAVVGTVVDTAANIGRDVSKTVNRVGEDLVHGDIPGAFTDVRTGAFSVRKDLTSGVQQVGGELIGGGLKIAGDVVKGAANLVVVTIKFVKDTVQQAVQFVLNHTGVVGQFIGKILEKIGSTVSQLIGWVLDKLGWGDILRVHDSIVSQFNDSLDNLLQLQKDMKKQSDQYFTELSQNLSSDINASLKVLGTYDTPIYEPQKSFFSDAIENVEWLLSKLIDYEASSTAVYAMITVNGDDGVTGPVNTFLKTALKALGDDNSAVEAALQDAKKYLLAAFTNPNTTPTLAMSAILEVVKAAGLASLTIASAVFDAVLDLIPLVLDSFRTIINQKLDIPFLTDLYGEITREIGRGTGRGSDLTVLDLTALLVAIPTTLISKGMGAGVPFSTHGALAQTLEKMDQPWIDWGNTYGSLHIIQGLFSVAGDVYDGVNAFTGKLGEGMSPVGKEISGSKTASVDVPGSIISYINQVLAGISQCAACPSGYPNFDDKTYGVKDLAVRAPDYWARVIWNCQWPAWVIGLVASAGFTTAEKKGLNLNRTMIAKDIMRGATAAWGIAHMALMSVLDVKDRAKADRLDDLVPDKITEAGEVVWNDDAKAQLRAIYKDLTGIRLTNFETKIKNGYDDDIKDFKKELKEFINYKEWLSDGQLASKGFSDVMDAFPEIGQVGAMPHLVEETGGLSLIATAIFDLLGNWGEGITYLKRTADNALL